MLKLFNNFSVNVLTFIIKATVDNALSTNTISL